MQYIKFVFIKIYSEPQSLVRNLSNVIAGGYIGSPEKCPKKKIRFLFELSNIFDFMLILYALCVHKYGKFLI